MALSPISLLPEVLDLKLYCGDGVQLRLVVTDSLGAPIDLTGDITAQVRQTRSNSVVSADFAVDIIDAPGGIAVISLSGDQTAALHGEPETPLEEFKGVWDVQWIPLDSEPVTILQGKVESSLDVTRS